MKPSPEELQSRVEFLAKKRRSAKRKVPTASENNHATRGKVLKLEASSSLSSTREQGPLGQFRVRGRPQHPAGEVSNMTSPQVRSPHATIAKSPPGRTAEPPLDILPISIRSPLAQTAELPSGASKGEGRKHLGLERDED